MKKLKFGIIGTGAIADIAHAPSIKEVPEAELTAVCDKSRERAETFAKKWGVKEIYTDDEHLTKSKNVDAVIVCTPNNYHLENTIAAAENGKHVLCEKPMAPSLQDAREMIKVCEKHNVKLMVALNQRWWNQIGIAKMLIDKDVIGEIYGFRSVWAMCIGPEGFPAATDCRYRAELSGGGTAIDASIHRVDLGRFFLGDVKRVFAEIRRVVIPGNTDDDAWIMLRFVKKAMGFVCSNYYTPVPTNPTDLYGLEGMIHISTETFTPFESVPIAVYTTKKASELPEILKKYFYPQIKFFEKPDPTRKWISIIPEREYPYINQLKAFIECVEKDTKEPVSGEEGYKSLEVVLAAYKSSMEKAWVDLPLKDETFKIPEFESKEQ
jgi:predicted dehydrogenase